MHHSYISGIIVFFNSRTLQTGILQTGPNQFVENQKQNQDNTRRFGMKNLPKRLEFFWVGGNRSKERDQKSELVLGSTYQILKGIETTRFEILIFGKQIKLPQIEFSRKYKTCLVYVPNSSSAPRLLGAAYIPILLSEVEQEQRPSGNGDREAIVVEDALCDSEGVRAYTAFAPHYDSKST